MVSAEKRLIDFITSRRWFASKTRDVTHARVLDTASLQMLAVIPVGPRTWWTALTPDGRFLWATVGRTGEVAVIDTQSNAVVGRVRCGTLPWGVAIANVP